MIKNYVDIVQMLDDEMVEIANSEQLEEYVRANYERWAINWMGGNTHVFIGDEELYKLIAEERKAYEFFIEKNNVDLDGVEIKDIIELGAIIFLSLNELEFYNDRDFMEDENGGILGWAFSEDVEKLIRVNYLK